MQWRNQLFFSSAKRLSLDKCNCISLDLSKRKTKTVLSKSSKQHAYDTTLPFKQHPIANADRITSLTIDDNNGGLNSSFREKTLSYVSHHNVRIKINFNNKLSMQKVN